MCDMIDTESSFSHSCPPVRPGAHSLAAFLSISSNTSACPSPASSCSRAHPSAKVQVPKKSVPTPADAIDEQVHRLQRGYCVFSNIHSFVFPYKLVCPQRREHQPCFQFQKGVSSSVPSRLVGNDYVLPCVLSKYTASG